LGISEEEAQREARFYRAMWEIFPFAVEEARRNKVRNFGEA
jgi:hypothetical protein